MSSTTLDIGATGMLAQQLNVDVISNNIANMTTTGFKRQRAEFQDLLYENKVRPGATSSDIGTIVPAGIQLGLGVRTGSVYRIHEQGAMRITENPLDLGLIGEGYFQVQMPSGETGYSRDGSLQVNESGELVNSAGYAIEPSITIPEDALNIVINASGEVLVDIEGQTAPSNVGQLQLAMFANDAGLEAIGGNIFLETDASGAPTTGVPNQNGFALIEQGALEGSNVNVVEEISNLIAAQRAYEMNSKVIRTGDEMLNTIGQLR